MMFGLSLFQNLCIIMPKSVLKVSDLVFPSQWLQYFHNVPDCMYLTCCIYSDRGGVIFDSVQSKLVFNHACVMMSTECGEMSMASKVESDSSWVC